MYDTEALYSGMGIVMVWQYLNDYCVTSKTMPIEMNLLTFFAKRFNCTIAVVFSFVLAIACVADSDYSTCWTFRTDPGYYLAVRTADGFEVESCGDRCSCDALTVYCGESKQQISALVQ